MRQALLTLQSTLQRAGQALLLVSLLLGGLDLPGGSLLTPSQAAGSAPLVPLTSTEEEEDRDGNEHKEQEARDGEVWNRSRGSVRHARSHSGAFISQVALPLRGRCNPERQVCVNDRIPHGSGAFLRC